MTFDIDFSQIIERAIAFLETILQTLKDFL